MHERKAAMSTARPFSRPLFAAIVLSSLAALSPACRYLRPSSSPDLQPSEGVESAIAEKLPAYVFIGGGSGAVISPDGYVITNAHVAGRSRRWKLRTVDGRYYAASVIGIAPGTDLCLLKMDHAQDLPHFTLGDSDDMQAGDVVIAVGNPFGLGNLDGKPTVTLGVVSAMHMDRPHAYDAIQTDTPINPGNSGGPLINLKGELVGITAQIETRFGLRQNTGVGYAISSNQVRRFLPALMAAEGKEVLPGRIVGIRLAAALDAPAVVEEVSAGTQAGQSGIMKGDVIRSVGDAPVATVRELVGALGRYPVGVEVPLAVERGDPPEQHHLTVPLAPRGQPYVGIQFAKSQPQSLAVDSVEPGGPAERAGVQKGDVIVGVGPIALRDRRQYETLLRRLSPGIAVPLVLRRDNRTVTVSIVIGETAPGQSEPPPRTSPPRRSRTRAAEKRGRPVIIR